MNKHWLILASAGALAVAFLGLGTTGSRADKDDEKIVVPKDIAAAVNKLADEAGKGNNVEKDTAAFFKKHDSDLKKAMWVFKPRMEGGEGGFGVGKKGTYTPDGIEGIIITNGNPRHKPMTAAQLKMAEADFTRLADITLAMAELTHEYTPKKKAPMKDPKDWTKFTEEMKKGATDLKAAVKANNPNATKAAFTKLYSSCSNCHAVFRD